MWKTLRFQMQSMTDCTKFSWTQTLIVRNTRPVINAPIAIAHNLQCNGFFSANYSAILITDNIIFLASIVKDSKELQTITNTFKSCYWKIFLKLPAFERHETAVSVMCLYTLSIEHERHVHAIIWRLPSVNIELSECETLTVTACGTLTVVVSQTKLKFIFIRRRSHVYRFTVPIRFYLSIFQTAILRAMKQQILFNHTIDSNKYDLFPLMHW